MLIVEENNTNFKVFYLKVLTQRTHDRPPSRWEC